MRFHSILLRITWTTFLSGANVNKATPSGVTALSKAMLLEYTAIVSTCMSVCDRKHEAVRSRGVALASQPRSPL